MAFKMKGSSYKMGGHKTKATMAYMKNMKSPLEQAKPDYPDIDGDGNTTESMKKAAADKKSPMEMKSPMKRAGIYKTLEDGTMVQIPQSEADTYGDGYEGDAVSMSYTGDDAIAFNKENQIPSGTERTKGMTESLMASYPTHTAGKKKRLKGTGKTRYNPKGTVYKLDNRIQAKINAGEPLTDKEKLHQQEALRNLSMDRGL